MTAWPDHWARPTEGLRERLSVLQALLLDVDGVFTDGTVLRTEDGQEARWFSVVDGHGIAMLREAGVIVGAVSRENSTITRARMEKLRLDEIHIGATDKAAVMRDIVARRALNPARVAFIGDDLPDLAAFDVAGIRIAPANAHPAVREAADLVLHCSGGHGAVREACEVLLAARGEGPMANGF
jgi:3-deoxy-D-manno-octulosonate 8-phosphate phosphatase (KDO 8-P phosphatase)